MGKYLASQVDGLEVQVLINGTPVDFYPYKEDNYIIGKVGSSFTLRVKNTLPQEVKVIVTVDGLSVLDAKPVYLNKGDETRGYIIPSYSYIDIPGWRKSLEEVAKFTFSEPKSSYSSKLGDGNDLGVIGVALYVEESSKDNFLDFEKLLDAYKKAFPLVQEHHYYHDRYVYPYPYYNPPFWIQCPITCGSQVNNIIGSGYSSTCNVGSESTANFISDASVPSEDNVEFVSNGLGTAYGEFRRNSVVETVFKSKDIPKSIVIVRYDTKENLVKIGVPFKDRLAITKSSPFKDYSSFCPEPK